MRVHNHGIEEDEGLSCRETVINGHLLGACMRQRRWAVRRWKDGWGVFDRDICHDSFPTLEQAHTYATQCAVADVLFEEGGLSRLNRMKQLENAAQMMSLYGSQGHP